MGRAASEYRYSWLEAMLPTHWNKASRSRVRVREKISTFSACRAMSYVRAHGIDVIGALRPACWRMASTTSVLIPVTLPSRSML
jgi:hypothetical protein